ncbi:MAG: hypothetical protein MSS66_07230 [Selenomonadaceae bacterium]|nr:hypothetical protein [Selenomonadaceae bacterium]
MIAVRGGRYGHSLGAAIDIGTTTLAAYLCDLQTGEVLQKSSRRQAWRQAAEWVRLSLG